MRLAALALLALALVLVALLSSTYFVRVATESMAPTLLVGDRLLVVRRAVLPRRSPRRGQVVVFTAAGDRSRRLVKRVAAVGGDTVPADRGTALGARRREVAVPPGGLYVLGDNGRASHDSREYGCIGTDRVKGRALLVVWPPGRARRVRCAPPRA
ncbi:signal peptidase I [Streptomyces sp. NPDC017979]|uniref:signal peptidase I n=1 Tax=Streptomyces sp. NPDC017979 TaxID=3365024 RepID=UPI0037BDC24B